MSVLANIGNSGLSGTVQSGNGGFDPSQLSNLALWVGLPRKQARSVLVGRRVELAGNRPFHAELLVM